MPIPIGTVANPAGRPGLVLEGLESTRRGMSRYRLVMASTCALLAGLAVASVLALADVAWVLPTWARAIGLAVVLMSGLAIVVRGLFSPGRGFGKSEAAAEVEASFPELGQRVRTALEYSEPTSNTASAHPTLIRALFNDADRQAKGLDFPGVVPWPTWIRRASALGVGLVAIVAGLGYDPAFRVAAWRLLLLPAHYSTLVVDSGDKTVREGADFTLRATLTGRAVDSVRWLRRPSGSTEAWTVAPLVPLGPVGEKLSPVVGPLEALRKDIRADFEYRVIAGELESPTYRVTVSHPLNLKSFEAAIEPPGYTRIKPSVAKEGNFRVLEGSKVQFRIGLDRVPLSAKIVWTAEGAKAPTTLPLTIEGGNLSGDLPPLLTDVRYEIQAGAADGMRLEPLRFAIKVQPDEKPSVRFVKPAESFAAIPTTEVPLKLTSSDDHGLTRVGIAYRMGDGPEESLFLANPGDQPPSFEALATLAMEKLKLTYADSLNYRGFVEDNREPERHRVSTELRYIDILPFKQEYQITDRGGPGGSSVSLEELILRQRQALNRALAHAEDRPIEAKLADRLSKDEAEIASVTSEFADRLAAEFGLINPLEDAAKQMEAATVTLASRDFEMAIPQEQAALTALTKARQNLRKLLTTDQTAGQCRKIDRAQQDQKLRKPPEDKSKEAELAKLEQDLQKLSEAEKRFAEEVTSQASGGAKLDKKDGAKPSPPEQQRAATQEADRLAKLVKTDPSLTDLARARMDRAAEQVKGAEASLKAGRDDDAADLARLASESLDQLKDQVAGLKGKELGDRIAKARDLAREGARAERDLAKKVSSEPKDRAIADQQGLVESTRTLADLLERLGSDAVEEDQALGQAIARAAQANAPGRIEQAMRRALDSIASGEGDEANREMVAGSDQLDALARDLESARRDYMQPKLQQLLAAEKKAAEVQKALESAASESKKLEAEMALSDLARALGATKPGEGAVKDAVDALSQIAQAGATTGWGPPQKSGLKAGLFAPPVSYTNAVRGVSRALQARIQELILADALVDRDGPVPPGYKEKVENYFRLLSEDMR